MRFSIFLLMICLISCSKGENYAKEGRQIASDMVCLLSNVENKEDMQRVAPLFKKDVENLTSLMIKAKERGVKGDDGIDFALSERLEIELARVLEIEGVEKIISELEQDSLHRLDAFHRRLNR